ncbi:hypothetical protein H7F33_03280 [Pedobacter sp. PAMC26386]|nr:hypothetical protein H7F33_03280 [Pedobacter sp. PAMC26386]
MIQDETIVINNLFGFWTFAGNHSKTILSASDFKAVFPKDSDWPKRIFDLGNGAVPKIGLFKRISAQIGQGDLPDMLTLTESMSSHYNQYLSEAGFTPKMKQLGMIIDLSKVGFIPVLAAY